MEFLGFNGKLITQENIPASFDGSLAFECCSFERGFALPLQITGNLRLEDCILEEGFFMPESVLGNLILDGCMLPPDFQLPKHLAGSLYLSNVTAETVALYPGGYRDFQAPFPKTIQLPATIYRSLSLVGYVLPETLCFPRSIAENLSLIACDLPQKFTLSPIGKSLYLNQSKLPGHFSMPEVIQGDLSLRAVDLTTIQLPARVEGNLDLTGAVLSSEVVLPASVKGILTLALCKLPKGYALPTTIELDGVSYIEYY
jgi:hypothetical protein